MRVARWSMPPPTLKLSATTRTRTIPIWRWRSIPSVVVGPVLKWLRPAPPAVVPTWPCPVLGLLAGYDDAAVWIAEDKVVARILHADESWTIEGAEGKTFSIIAIAPNTEVSEHGLEWELDHSPLALLADTGISNIVRGTATIDVHSGVAIAYLLHQGFPGTGQK